MVEIGKYINKIRRNKGYSQNYVSNNILSQAAYSKFEAGITEVNATALIKILQRLEISLDEVLLINQEYSSDSSNLLIKQFFSLTYNDVGLLEKIITGIDNYTKTEKNIMLEEIRLICVALVILKQSGDLNEAIKIVEPVWKRLSRQDNWYLLDIRLINSILFLFPNDIALDFTNNILKKLANYNDFLDSKKLIISFRVNLALLLIKGRDYKKALYLLKETVSNHGKEIAYPSLAICFERLAICYKKLGRDNLSENYLIKTKHLLEIYEDTILWENIQAEYNYYINMKK